MLARTAACCRTPLVLRLGLPNLVALLACNARQPPPLRAAGPQARDVDVGRGATRAPSSPISVTSEGPDVPCQTDDDCREGLCLTPAIDAQYSRVFRECPNGRAWRERHRLYTCVRPGCTSDAQCQRGARCAEPAMLPFPQRACVTAGCVTAADCRARARGQCVAFVAAAHCGPGGWACSYPTDECAPRDVDRRCPPSAGSITRCVPSEGRFRCVSERPAEPRGDAG